MYEIKENVSLKAYHTFGMDVSCQYWAEYDTVEDLRALMEDERIKDKKWWHIGSGSNLLLTGDYDGAMIHSQIKGIHITSEDENMVKLRIGAAEEWDKVCQYAIEHNWYGAENLSGIPGEVGAAAVQNIGAYGVEIANLIESVETWDMQAKKSHTFAVKDCKYGYRDSIFKQPVAKGRYIITYVNLQLKKEPHFNLEYGNLKKTLPSQEPTLSEVRETVINTRNAKLPDPEVVGNAGSFFKNPIITTKEFEALQAVYPLVPFYAVDKQHVKIPAAWLIEQCGWKGRNIGGAGVYDKQCLVLVNRNNATPQEMIQLAEAIIRTIKERFNITIEPEVNIVS